MRLISRNKKAQMSAIGAGVGLLITIAICILIYYNIQGSANMNSVDTKLGGHYNATSGVWTGPHPANNATNQVNNQAGTFFTVAPIIAIVIIAVTVIMYVKAIG